MIRLIQGDCLENLKLLNEQNIKVDALITDIPYFKVVNESWDSQWDSEESYLKWLEDFIVLVDSVLKDNSSIMIFTSRQLNRKVCNILDKYFKEQRIIIWSRKRGFNSTRGNALASGYEPIAYYTKGKGTFNNLKIKVDSDRPEYNTGILKDGVSLSDVWSDIKALPHNSREKVNHPTQKPIALMERCVSLVTNEGDLVLDCFMGSGTTGIACNNLKRNFIGIEKDDNYYKIAFDRLKRYSPIYMENDLVTL
jgi:DNA modification methylase